MVDFEKMEKIRARAEEIVNDPKTAESLKPYYRQFCKRPCFHDEYLKTYNRESVTLVDTDGKGLDKITEKGIFFNGKEYEVDCIIFATGFEVGTEYTRRSGYEIVGKNNLSISEKWKDGLVTYHGMHCRGFPNTFFFGPAQGGFTAVARRRGAALHEQVRRLQRDQGAPRGRAHLFPAVRRLRARQRAAWLRAQPPLDPPIQVGERRLGLGAAVLVHGPAGERVAAPLLPHQHRDHRLERRLQAGAERGEPGHCALHLHHGPPHLLPSRRRRGPSRARPSSSCSRSAAGRS